MSAFGERLQSRPARDRRSPTRPGRAARTRPGTLVRFQGLPRRWGRATRVPDATCGIPPVFGDCAAFPARALTIPQPILRIWITLERRDCRAEMRRGVV